VVIDKPPSIPTVTRLLHSASIDAAKASKKGKKAPRS
jgi:hypothetical protein